MTRGVARKEPRHLAEGLRVELRSDGNGGVARWVQRRGGQVQAIPGPEARERYTARFRARVKREERAWRVAWRAPSSPTRWSRRPTCGSCAG